MTDRYIETLLVRFKNPICQKELPFLRGAIVNAIGRENILLHNHVENGLRYSYPLIQYKRIGGCAAIMCITDGVKTIDKFLESSNRIVNIGRRENVNLEVESIDRNVFCFGITEEDNMLSIRKYLPFNQENHARFENTDSIVEKYAMIEKCLVGNILSLAKGINVHFEKEIYVKLQNISAPHHYKFKNINMLGFDVIAKTNVSLPDYIGLGGKVSFGYGTAVNRQ